VRQLVERRLLPRLQRHDGGSEQRGRHGALRRRLHGRDRKARARKRVQRSQTRLLVAARHAGHICHDQLARRQDHDLPLGKAAQIGGKTVRRVVVIGQHEHRTRRIRAERRRQIRLVNGGQTDRQDRCFPLIDCFFQRFVFIQISYTFCNLCHMFTSVRCFRLQYTPFCAQNEGFLVHPFCKDTKRADFAICPDVIRNIF